MAAYVVQSSLNKMNQEKDVNYSFSLMPSSGRFTPA